MNAPFNHLASHADQRRIRLSPSSASSLGLRIEDIVQRGIVDRPDEQTAIAPIHVRTLAEQVFQALADAKIWTSKVAMHMHREARDRYFRQLDLLHDCDEWFGEEQPVKLTSYKGFVRFMLVAGGTSKPALALSPQGFLIAVWQSGRDRLTIEFSSEVSAQWVIRKQVGDQLEQAAGKSSLARLPAVLSPYLTEAWLGLG